MKPIRHALTFMLATAMLWHPVRGSAEDIDIYSGQGISVHTPNVLIVMDNAASFSARADGFGNCQLPNASGVSAANSLHDTSGGVEQCALHKVITDLPTNADGTARVNIGFMVYNASGISAIEDNVELCSRTNGGCLVYPLTPMSGATKTAMLNWITTWQTNSAGDGSYWIKAASQATAETMQEAWTYYAGGTGPSGRDYSGIKPSSGCQKNFVIFIGNAYENSSSPGDGGTFNPVYGGRLTLPAAQQALLGRISTEVLTNTIDTLCPGAPYTFPDSNNHKTGGFYADEWARFMNQSDLYSTPANTQSIITYTVGLLGTSCQASYAALLENMADYGGGKYFPTRDYTSIVSAIMQILNEIQAVNSVFASSSLPVSVNAQGTYLNQIYMGMFRPDSKAQPRWVGNLKQYAFKQDTASDTLSLGDSVKRSALDSAGAGFVSANAISYWTCSRSDNPYLTDTAKTSTTELATLTSQGQICASDPAGGFWANTQGMANTAGMSYDLADGELVEKGGAAQQMRLANLNNSYATDSTTNTRKLYTFCPAGASCNHELTHADNAFVATNTALGSVGMFGGNSSSVNIATLERVGDVVTVTTASNHGFVDSTVAIANATPSAYNGNKAITVVSDTQFRYYPITTYPLTPANTSATGVNYYAFAAVPQSGVTLARATGSNTITATATAHGFATGDTVMISGSSEPQYNHPAAVVTRVNANTFTYNALAAIVETPPVSTGAGGQVKQGSSGTWVDISSTVRTLFDDTATPHKCSNQSPPCWKVTVTTATPHGFIFTTGDNTGIRQQDMTAPASPYNYPPVRKVTSTNATTYYFYYPGVSSDTPVAPATISGASATLLPPTGKVINILTRSGNTATATTTESHVFPNNSLVGISATAPGADYSAYLGIFTVSTTIPDSGPTSNTFTYTVPVTPTTPATAISGATMTAIGGAPANNEVINWVRGEDNNDDEHGPGGSVTVRPSLHGDVLHSRPTVINYGGQRIRITATATDPDDSTKRIATASGVDVAKIGGVGAAADIRFENGQTCPVTVATTTTFRYSGSNCGIPGIQDVATTSASTIVYYGDNGGVFHAVNGNQDNPAGSTLPAPGNELWGFIPSEMFGKLNRQRTNSPQLELSTTPGGISPAPRPKDYFVDGPIGLYQDVLANGTTTTAYIYLTMRRGGGLVYVLDVSDPATPKLKWKVDNTTLWKVSGTGEVTTVASGLSELGQTWSQPKVARVAHGGGGKWVLIFGAGYATEEDDEPPVTADTMGRGIFILDAFTGELVWKATYGASNACSGSTTQAACTVTGMKYSIPADITLLDRDLDSYGYIDRLYAADTGGNIWRVDLEPDGSTPDKWRIYKLAELGCSEGPCSIPPGTKAQRKFFFAPEVITTSGYDAVIAGTGDREHPLYVDEDDTRTNRLVLLKDTYTGKSAAGMTAITNDDLRNKTDANCLSGKGYKYSLERGEKVVNAPLVTAGSVYFGTHKPVAPELNACNSTLGTAKGYKLEPFNCAAPTSVEFAGGGMPPSPVSGVVNIVVDGVTRQAAFLIGGGDRSGAGGGGSALEGQKPTINVPTTRTRTYWYKSGK